MTDKQMVVFFDIDGTLLPEGAPGVPEETIEAIHAAQRNGHLCFINTGRPMGIFPRELFDVGFDGIITACGGMATYHGETLWRQEESIAAGRQVIEASRACGLTIIYENYAGRGYDCFLIPDSEERMAAFARAEKRGWQIFRLGERDDFPLLKFIIDKSKGGDLERFRTLIDGFSFTAYDERWEECVPLGLTKGRALIRMMAHLGLPLEQSIAVGDNRNDLPMLEVCPNSVAMGNGEAKTFDVSFITRRCDEGGIPHMLRHFGLID
ncbi:MAG: HAD family phosphatase [Clostridia bacterium]|nr:HAD family phosphatase [Clostridia bacterium]